MSGLSETRAYATSADTRSTDFAGASAMKAIPTTTSTTEPMSSARAIRSAKACPAVRTAWPKLDHAVKAIRL